MSSNGLSPYDRLNHGAQGDVLIRIVQRAKFKSTAIDTIFSFLVHTWPAQY